GSGCSSGSPGSTTRTPGTPAAPGWAWRLSGNWSGGTTERLPWVTHNPDCEPTYGCRDPDGTFPDRAPTNGQIPDPGRSDDVDVEALRRGGRHGRPAHPGDPRA